MTVDQIHKTVAWIFISVIISGFLIGCQSMGYRRGFKDYEKSNIVGNYM